MGLEIVGSYYTSDILTDTVEVMYAPMHSPPINWATICYLSADKDGVIPLKMDDVLFITASAQLVREDNVNAQIITDVGLTDGTWESSDVDNWLFTPVPAVGTDLALNPIHYYPATRIVGGWVVPQDIASPNFQFRFSSASTDPDPNGRCTVRQGTAHLSVTIMRNTTPTT